MKRFHGTGWLGVMVVGWVALLCANAPAQVVEQLPENASIVVKFKNVQAIDTKVMALLQRLGVPQMGAARMDPALQDPLAALIEKSGFKDGVDKNGDLAIVVLKLENAIPTDTAKNGQPPAHPLGLVLIPITNYQALLGNFANNKKDGALDVVDVKNFPADLFVADWGKYAAVSPDKEALVKGTGLKLSGVLSKEMDSKDVSVFVNVQALGPVLLDEIKLHKAEILENIANAMKQVPNGNTQMTPVVQAVVSQALAGGEHLLGECTGAVLSGNLGEEGMNFALVADFKADSYIGKLVQGTHNVEGSLTVGLPDEKYIFYGGHAINGGQSAQLISDILGPIMAELVKANPDKAKAADAYLHDLRAQYANTQMQNVGILAPSGPLGLGSLLQVLSVVNGDADKIVAADKGMKAFADDFLKMITGSGVTPLKVSLTMTDDAKTVSGVSFTQIQEKFEAPANDPAAAQMQQMMVWMYGANGVTAWYGKVDEKHVLTAACVDDAALAAAIAAIKANDDPLGKLAEVQLVNKNLPARRAGVYYFAADVLANTVVDYVNKFPGMHLPPLALKPHLPPIGISVGSEENAYRMEAFVPTELLENMVTAAKQMKENMSKGAATRRAEMEMEMQKAKQAAHERAATRPAIGGGK